MCEFVFQIYKHNNKTPKENRKMIFNAFDATKAWMPEEIKHMIDQAIIELQKA